VEEPAIHRAVAELAQSAAVRKRQDRLAAKFGGNTLQPFGDFIKSFVPGNPLKLSPCGAGAPARDRLRNSPAWSSMARASPDLLRY
jgi:hypothetical protein